MTWLFTAAQVKQITATLEASPVPIYVIAVPFDDDEDFPDYESYFLDQLYGCTHRNGTFLIIGPSGDIFDAEYQVPRDISLPIATELGPDSAVTPALIAASTPGRLLSLIKLVDASAVDSQAAGRPAPEYSSGRVPRRPAASRPARHAQLAARVARPGHHRRHPRVRADRTAADAFRPRRDPAACAAGPDGGAGETPTGTPACRWSACLPRRTTSGCAATRSARSLSLAG